MKDLFQRILFSVQDTAGWDRAGTKTEKESKKRNPIPKSEGDTFSTTLLYYEELKDLVHECLYVPWLTDDFLPEFALDCTTFGFPTLTRLSILVCSLVY